jgi:hypothetical protein
MFFALDDDVSEGIDGMQIALARTRVAARYTLRGIGYVVAYVALGTFTSVVATIFGLLLVCIIGMGWAGPVAIALIPIIPIVGLPIGFLLSVPVTFVVCPLLSLFLKRYPATNISALALGSITGGLVTWWWVGLSHTFSKMSTELVVGGTAAGFLAGVIYGTMVWRIRRQHGHR